jgi:RNA polymerase sigma factor (sigma-70 family)
MPIPNPMGQRKDWFSTTHWSVVRSAGHSSSPAYREALATLCQAYWFPLYNYLRCKGHDSHDAEDYTQAFFARMLEKHDFRMADPSRGKFRTFMLTALKNFVANEHRRERAQKRGGEDDILSLDFVLAEEQYSRELTDGITPEQLFERSWSLAVIHRAMSTIEKSITDAGEERQFFLLRTFLVSDNDSISYKDAAATLGMAEGAVKVAVHRLRKRFQKALRDEIAQTVTSESEIDEEIKQLIAALSR